MSETEQTKYPPIVEFRNVTKIWNKGSNREFVALKDVSFCVEDLPKVGEFIAILGPSGCGKSTLLNLIAGFQEFYPPTSGEILIRGEKITGPGIDRGMVFQKYSSFPFRTVLQNVRFGLELNREKLNLTNAEIDRQAKEWCEKVGLGAHLDKFPHQLSGGQQQRVAIARTLSLKPKIILMDEAFSALDEPTRLEMQGLLVALWREVEATVFMVTHSIGEAVFLGDRIWVFSQAPGTIAFEKTNKQLARADASPRDVQKSAEFMHQVEEISACFTQIDRRMAAS